MSLYTYQTARLHTRYVAYKTVLRGRLLDSTGHKIFTFHGWNQKLEAEGRVLLTRLLWSLASLAENNETKNSNSEGGGGGEQRITNGPNWNGSHEVIYSFLGAFPTDPSPYENYSVPTSVCTHETSQEFWIVPHIIWYYVFPIKFAHLFSLGSCLQVMDLPLLTARAYISIYMGISINCLKHEQKYELLCKNTELVAW